MSTAELHPFLRHFLRFLVVGFTYISFLLLGLALTPRTTRLWVLDVGQGDAILIRTPDQRTVLVDGGPDRSLLYGLGRHLPPWVRTVDLLVVTHPHTDHYVGFIELLARYRVRTLLLTGARNDPPEYAEFEAAVRASGARVQLVTGPARYDLGSGVQLRLLYPDRSLAGSVPANPNDASIVLQLSAGGARALLTGDLERDGLQQLAGAGVASDLLKVAHHGSADALAPAFYAAVQPVYAVISVGPNHFGHPSLRTEAALRRAGATVLTTQADGDVGFVAGASGFTQRPTGWWPAW